MKKRVAFVQLRKPAGRVERDIKCHNCHISQARRQDLLSSRQQKLQLSVK